MSRYAFSSLKAPQEELFDFLNSHPNLVTISFPFTFWPRWRRFKQAAPHPTIREVVFTDEEASQLKFFTDPMKIFPNLDTRTIAWNAIVDYIELPGLISLGDHILSPDTALTRLNLVVWVSELTWPSFMLRKTLGVIRGQCPNLRELHLRFTGNAYFTFAHAPRVQAALLAEAARIPTITLVGLSGMHPGSSHWGRVKTLTHMVGLPWKVLFPSLEAIRINEDLDYRELKGNRTLGSAREDATVRLEDRFGDTLVE